MFHRDAPFYVQLNIEQGVQVSDTTKADKS